MHVHVVHQVGHLRHGLDDVVGLRCGVSLRKRVKYRKQLYFTGRNIDLLQINRMIAV